MSALRKCIGGVSFLAAKHMCNNQTSTPQRSYKRWVAPTLKELKRRKDRMGPEPLYHRSTFLDWNYKAERYAFGKRLNEEFRDDLLLCAFTHRSYIIQEENRQKEVGIEEPKLSLEDNRELIEKGEQFMRQYVNIYVHALLPRFPEEGVRAICDHLMKEKLLAHVSSNIGTKDLILCSDFPVEPSTLTATLKAVVAALLESSGAERAGLFVRDLVITQLAGKDVNDIWQPSDPLQILSDVLAREGRSEPEPRLISEIGKNTILATYRVGLYVNKEFVGAGFGESVEVATQMAALDALKRLFGTTDNMAPFSFQLNVTFEDTKQNVSIDKWSVKNVVQC